MRRFLRHDRQKFILGMLLLLLAAIWIFPVLISTLSSFNTMKAFKHFAKLRNIIPLEWTFENYVWVWENASNPLPNMIANSVFVSVSQVVLTLIVSSTSAYAYERLDFPFREKLFWILFGLGMIPGVIALVPQYLLYDAIGLTDNLWGLITPYVLSLIHICSCISQP